jgi:transposase
MPMLAEVVDAVVGADTHRDTHELEIAHPTGAVIDTRSIGNDTDGYAHAVGWIAEHAPGPRVVVAVEGTRSYGAGLARALAGAGLIVVECEHPTRKERRRRGKSDAIDAHLAVAGPSSSMPRSCPRRAPTGTARRCAPCCAPARS